MSLRSTHPATKGIIIDTLFFDLDGTLTDNYAGIAGCIVHALERLERPAPPAVELHACIGPPLRQNFSRLMSTTDPALIERALAHYRERFDVHGWQENVPYPGIHAALQTLVDRNFRMFVCTSKPHKYATRIVEHFELMPFFEDVYGPDLAGKLDDKRDLLRHALGENGVDASRAMMIGDRAQDVRAALANGLRSMGVLYGYGSAEELTGAGAHLLCESVALLPDAIGAAVDDIDDGGRKIDASS